MKTNLLNYDLNGLTQHFAEMGEKPFRAKQVKPVPKILKK